MLSKTTIGSALLVLSSAFPVLAVVSEWGQCGGINYSGDTQCTSGLICKQWNPYYYQCVTPQVAGTTSSPSATPPPISTTSTSIRSSTTTTPSSSSSTSTSIYSPPVSSTTTTSSSTLPSATGGLDALAKRKSRYFGCALDHNHLSDTPYINIIKAEFGQLTPENSMKWDQIEPSRNSFTFTNAQRFVDFATTNGKTIRGHTLVWHSQLPSWVSNGGFNNATLVDIMKNHITTVMTRWKGQIHTWDVVNEVFNDDGTFRTSVFYTTIGEYFIDISFRTAKSVDPIPVLAINDYNIDGTGAKSTAMINLVTRMKARGTPVEQIGVQAHLIVGSVPQSIATNWQAFANLGVSVAITELDIRTNTPASTSSLAQQSTDYQRVVASCFGITQCRGVTVWGASDKYSWVPDTFSGQGAALPWDNNYNKKPAYQGIVNALTA